MITEREMDAVRIFRNTARLTIFTLFLMGSSGFSASANTHTLPALRTGAQVCDADPETETRAVYLPAIWRQVSETVITHEAMTKLVYQPASFHLDGTLVHEARVSERVIPQAPRTLTRYVILAPEQTGEITADGVIFGANAVPIDEAFYLKLLERGSDFRVVDQIDYWDVVFERYLDSLRLSQGEIIENLRRSGYFLTVPRVVSPDLSWVRDLSVLKVDTDIPVSILVEPAEIKYPSEQEVVDQWERFANTRLREDHKAYMCVGATLVVKDLGADSYPKKTYEDIGLKTPRFMTGPQIRYFNIFGTELK